jgi:hypothetical protein
MTKRDIQAMMAFMMEGECWAKQAEDYPCKRTKGYCSSEYSHVEGNHHNENEEDVDLDEHRETFNHSAYGEGGDHDEHEEDGDHDPHDEKDAEASHSPLLLATSALDTTNPIRMFPPKESTSRSDEAEWQYYIASYKMKERTEGIDFSHLRLPYLQRRLSQAKRSIENTYAAVFRTFANEDTQTVSISPDTYKTYWEGGFAFYREASGPKKEQDNDLSDHSDSQRRNWSLEELNWRAILAAFATGRKNPRSTSSTALESGVSEDFMEDVREILARALQKEFEKETESLMVIAMFDLHIVKLINDIRSEPQCTVSGVTKGAPVLPDIEPEVYQTFPQQFNEVFVRALEKERDFKKIFPGTFPCVRIQVVQILRNLRKAVQKIPDWIARHNELLASIRIHEQKIQRVYGTKDTPVSVKRKKGGGKEEGRASLRRKFSNRHCGWCSWKVVSRPQPECDCCSSWTAATPRNPCRRYHAWY